MVELIALKCPFSQLGMGNAFIEQSERLGIGTLEDVMSLNLNQLKRQKEFTYLWYHDLLNLLKKHDLLLLFQEKNI
ncbi:hypothetical protein [Mucilaginibacter sp. UYCu711]|uniref:hypothetical protein n=1 Tax=Mucilaginibacter sp. UYCu711 TaxID=3156339 RepID=UPI003D25B1C8